MNTSVLYAVFKRNFVSYFSNPTGYLFICVFVLLSSIAAFWPVEFFNTNLANLDQLNNNPYLNFFTIMLVFIPAITMGIWSDERRQGTDELLLTIPAGDFNVVLGKYLAAVAVFTVALLYSLACNYGLLRLLLGNPDVGLFLGTYAGYWLVGLAMLAIGMVASFLTGNLTIAFVLGVLFNAPLVLIAVVANATAEFLLTPEASAAIKPWGLHAQFQDFSRGVLSSAAAAYFLLIVAVMLYVSVILIGRRHWRSGRGTNLQPAFLFGLARAVGSQLRRPGDAPVGPGGMQSSVASWTARWPALATSLGPYCTTAALVGCLAVAYLVLHWALLRHWSGGPREPAGASRTRLVPVLHFAVLALAGLAVAAIYWERHSRTPPAAIPGSILLVVLGIYLVALVALAAGWRRYPHGASLVPGHCIVRFLALLLAAAGLTMVLQRHNARMDVTSERLSSLSPQTLKLLEGLKLDRPVRIEAFVSPIVPEDYVQTRLELVEHAPRDPGPPARQGRGPDPAHRAAERRRRPGRAPLRHHAPPRGNPQQRRRGHDSIFLGVAMTSGLQKVIVPFIDKGIPAEYEIIRSLCTVAQQKRKRVGILATDAPLYGALNMQTFTPSPNWPIIDELQKQYEVVRSGRQQAHHRALRRAAGRAAVDAGPRRHGELPRRRAQRAADGHFRGPLPDPAQ